MRRTITWLLYILMGVQILFGCAYFVTNFSARQEFAESFYFIQVTGVIYLVQLILAAVSTWYFLGAAGFSGKKYLRAYICAFLLTVPYLLQIHMAGLIWSFALSLFLWMLGLILKRIRQEFSGKDKTLLWGAYFLYGIICPDGLWLGGILLLFGDYFARKEQRKKKAAMKDAADAGSQSLLKEGEKIGGRLRFRLMAVLMAGMIFLANMGLNGAFPQARRIYRENNLGTAAVSRLVWPNFATNYFFWDEDVKAVLSEADAVDLSQRIDLLEKKFYPALAKAYGNRKATGLCLKMGYRCLMDRSRETVSEIGRDLANHLLIPFTIEKNLQGRGSSLTAWNYGRMKAHTPVLVKYYYRYGIFELPCLLLGSLLLWWFHKGDQISQSLKREAEGKEIKGRFNKIESREKLPVQGKFLLFTMLLYTLWYTMRSNLPIDYKLVLPILFIWYLAAIGGLLCQKAEG